MLTNNQIFLNKKASRLTFNQIFLKANKSIYVNIQPNIFKGKQKHLS